MMEHQRCSWANSSPAMQTYHDQEWGRPTYVDQELFERLCLETYQAGLSWATVLNKRAAFHRDFHDYQIQAVAAMTTQEIDAAMQDAGIIRNRRKLEATVNNAQAWLKVTAKFGSFANYFWAFVGESMPLSREVPTQTPLSIALAKDLKKRGFKFIGPIAAYAFMQSVGAVNDHEKNCAWR
ncbi:DNA-3-methyladenine glycosylase I [Loigolactobacillus zhaoyuanensis]|uniref:DNA-3-methyladenine glycosylase I n=1 Tax=Loigolactobacillus zhaoyuanensis TaxID=2486017 RepID=A0ABW8UAC8_9LACO|nr:DNA-3-methyladenine glycosylase I [Loigolactobacillus zhaoyuanensis]